MEITKAQDRQIEHCLPEQRCNVSHTNLHVISAILYVAEHGCKWRGLPKRFGNWHTVYTRKSLVQARSAQSSIPAVAACSDRTHQDRRGWLGQHHRQSTSGRHRSAKKGPQSIGKSRGRWSTKIHMVAAMLVVAADARMAITFALSPAQAHDAAEGRKLAT